MAKPGAILLFRLRLRAQYICLKLLLKAHLVSLRGRDPLRWKCRPAEYPMRTGALQSANSRYVMNSPGTSRNFIGPTAPLHRAAENANPSRQVQIERFGRSKRGRAKGAAMSVCGPNGR